MPFHLGKPILGMAVLSIICGGWLALHRPAPETGITLWVFDPIQYHDYADIIHADFKSKTRIDLVPANAMNMRLPVLFMSPDSAHEIPDVVEVPIGSMGLYLRAPAPEIGFLPLNHFLESSGFREIAALDSPGQRGWNARLSSDGRIYTFDGKRWIYNSSRQHPDAWIDRILPSRLVSSTKDGQIFGVPHDVHPVALAFREDLFREAGVPLTDDAGRSTALTWADLQEKCLAFQTYWHAHGFPNRHAIELPRVNSGMLSILLAQRRIDLVGADQSIHIADPKVAQTLAFYVQMVEGKRAIAGESAPDSALEYKDFSDGNLCALLMPDWKVNSFRKFAPELAGKMRLIPLPRFDPSDAPTASYGGTLICIPRNSPHPDDAWRLIEFLYFSPAGLADRKKLGILPPLPEQWANAEYRQADPYFGGEKSLELYADLARQVPPTRTTPINAMSLIMLSYVQSRAVAYLHDKGPAGLETRCQQLLDAAAADLQRRIDHAKFEE
ncbi:MAG TPA: extracellular solute-binding protein [Tepidisphaeraceae bacterium]|jgi:arabinosaccharide transport system substrate-binding protein|nr:extracellular solute-binding protein [Tepidisphaeraceae bacterium]